MKKRAIILIIILLATIGGTCGLSANPIQTAADTTVSAEYLRKIEQDNQRMNDSIRMLNIERQLAEYVEKKADRNLNLHMGLFGALMTLITCVIGVAVPLIINRSQRKKLDETAEKSEKAFAEAKKSADEAKALTYFMQALKEDDLDLQIDRYTSAIEIIPDNAMVYYNRGNAYHDKGEYDKAFADYTKAIEIDPEYSWSYNNRGNAYVKKGEYDKAIADYTKAIAIDPNNAEAYINRGLAYFNKGEYDKTIEDFDKAIEINPDYAEAHINRGAAYFNKGEYDKAIADYTNAIEINPDNAMVYYNRGIAYRNKGEYDKAIENYDKAIEIYPNYVEAYGNRGEANKGLAENLEADGKTPEALALYKAAVKDFDKFLELWTEDDENKENAIRLQKECEEAIRRLEGGDEVAEAVPSPRK